MKQRKNVFKKFICLSSALLVALLPMTTRAQTEAEKAMETFRKEEATRQATKAQEQAVASQKAAQEQSKKKSGQGSQTAMILGGGLLAAGAIMLAMSSTQPQLKVPAYVMLGGGATAMLAGMMMGQNADKAGGNAGGLGSFTNLGPGGDPTGVPVNNRGGTSNTSGRTSSAELGGSTSASIALDPEALQNGKVGEIFDKFEAATGIKREDFARGINAGISPAELLQGIGGASKEEIQAGIDSASSAGGGSTASDLASLAAETGLSDLYAEAQSEGLDFTGGGGKGLNAATGASTAGAGFDFGKIGDTGRAPAESSALIGEQFSEQVKAELARQGRSEQSIFQLITIRYRKLTPQLFGEELGFGTIESAGRLPAETL